MAAAGYKGLYLQATGDPLCFSFVTYTPQSREQMIACGDLEEDEEYLNPVVFDFLLFVSDVVLALPEGVVCPLAYDDILIRWSRSRGRGAQHEYLIQVSHQQWTESKQLVLERLQSVLSSDGWNGSRLTEPN